MNIATRNRQLKVSVGHDLAEMFKASCEERGVSMASEISRFMREASGTSLPAPMIMPDSTSTRRHRRKATVKIAGHLRAIADAEEDYKEHIPENLKSGVAYDVAAAAVDALEEAISLLDEAFS
jgi:hypothetical protein